MSTDISTFTELKLDSSTINSLAKERGDYLVSIYAPMMQSGREVQQNEIRWKNLINDAHDKLIQMGCSEEKACSLLEPASEKLSDPNFWQHQKNGLVFLLDNSKGRYLKSCCNFDEKVVVDESFYLRLIAPMADSQKHCFVIAATPNRVRLFEVQGDSIEEVELESLPDNLKDALNIDEYVSALQFHSTSRGSGNSRQAAVFHGQGGSDADVKKQDELLQFFHRLDDALASYLADSRAPLIFAGVDNVFPVFKKANSYQYFQEEFISGSPDDTDPQEFLVAVQPIMDKIEKSKRSEIVAEYQDKAHTNWASSDPAEIHAAAKMGQVSRLFISDEFDEAVTIKNGVAIRGSGAGDDSIDFGNHLIGETLRNGGTVFDITDYPLPKNETLAAVFRSPVGEYLEP